MEPLAADINQRYWKINELIKERGRGRTGGGRPPRTHPPGRTDGQKEGRKATISVFGIGPGPVAAARPICHRGPQWRQGECWSFPPYFTGEMWDVKIDVNQ